MKLAKSKVEELEEILNAPVYIDKTGQVLFNPGGGHEDIEGWILVPDEKINEIQEEKEV